MGSLLKVGIHQEVITGKTPYSERTSDVSVMMAVIEGKHPQRPVELSAGGIFDDGRWELLGRCWRMSPSERPSSTQVKDMVGTTYVELMPMS